MDPFVIFAIIAVIVIVIAVLGHLQALKRRKELKEWAEKRGLSFRYEKEYGLDTRYGMFDCLKKGSARYGYNFIEGNLRGSAKTGSGVLNSKTPDPVLAEPLKERRLCAFDYHYETYSTDSKGRRQTHHHYFSAVVLEVNLPLKPLYIRAESFFDKVGAFLGFDDINFESAEFSRKFCVTGPDKRWAFDVLHQEAMEFLLQAPVFALELQDRRIIAYRNNIFAIADFEAALDVAGGLLDQLPKSVLRELKGID